MGAEADVGIRGIRIEDAGAAATRRPDASGLDSVPATGDAQAAGMDAATRAELDALRVRAYGRAADIAGDPAAIARLGELEQLARAAAAPAARLAPRAPLRRPGQPDPEGWSDPPAVYSPPAAYSPLATSGALRASSPSGPPDSPAQDGAPGDEPTRAGRGIRSGLVAAVAVAIVLAAGFLIEVFQHPAVAPASADRFPVIAYGLSAGTSVLRKIPLDGQFGSYGTPPDDGAPDFPADGDVRWADYLGDYFGQDVWLGGVTSQSELLCLVLVDDGATRGRCQLRALWERGALLVSVPYASIDPAERPSDLASGQSIGVWWAPDDAVYVLRGAVPLLEAERVEASAAAAAPTGAPVAFEPPADSTSLLRVPIDGSFGSYHGQTTRDMPRIPALSTVLWSMALGEYYGFNLWLGGAEVDGSEVLCIVLATDGDSYVRSACGARDGWDRGGLFVSLPYTQVAPEERPDPLDPGERLGFWWTPDDTVRVLAGGSRPPSAVG